MKTILITGYKGFVGSNLTRLLENTYNVIGIDLKDGNNVLDTNYLNALFEFYDIDTIVHLAAIPGVGYSIEHSEEVLHNNIVGFDTLTKTAIKHNVSHIIYASSSSVYGDNGILKSPYAVTKKTNELQAQVYSNLSNTKFTGLRFFTVYGKNIRQDLAISKFIKAMQDNTPIHIYGDGTQSRDFTYVDDITHTIKLIIESDKQYNHQIFDIGYGQSVTVNELINTLKQLINPTFNKVIYEQEKPYDVKTTLANTDKIKDWFGFTPQTNLKEGLSKLISNQHRQAD